MNARTGSLPWDLSGRAKTPEEYKAWLEKRDHSEDRDMSLRDRCKEMLNQLDRNGILRQGSPVDDLMAFVQSEIGRTSDSSLEDTKSLILYFADEEGRDEMKAAILEARPGMYAKNIP